MQAGLRCARTGSRRSGGRYAKRGGFLSTAAKHVQSRRETMTVTAADTGPPGFNRSPRRAVFGKPGGISGIQGA
ncbi:hypothetical protein Esi_0017_0029 [Ectocarpus siliculosus]|uniref:Uncharacterized protein n=1 Tax=Ectocarpus siliculosus TaxID=2880 RepID=D7FMH9_ECTSI|nr:hypothetical protein Esi_0017_0029 [Ectocarpus siliculosus]|eukprot:CBJ25876.1 hypothetical protein Esi_0017_0029 [Ectocarpus siliculosus]